MAFQERIGIAETKPPFLDGQCFAIITCACLDCKREVPIIKELIAQWLPKILLLAAAGFAVHGFTTPAPQVDGRDPVKPFPYQQEEVSFENPRAKVKLSGTLTLPQGKGPFPAVMIVGGTGRHQRDGYTGSSTHKLLVLADYLTRRGVATLRYDKRGVGSSTGDYETATTKDFAEDAGFGVEFLKHRKEVTAGKIGIIGHSEGGSIASLAAASTRKTSFIVLLAGPGVEGQKLVLRQREWTDRWNSLDDKFIDVWQKMVRRVCEEIKRSNNGTVTQAKLDDIIKAELAPLAKNNPKVLQEARDYWQNLQDQYRLFGPWGKFFLSHDPKMTLLDVKCPVLALFGDKDGLVFPLDSIPAIESALKKAENHDTLVKQFENMNHGFQTCQAGASTEPADPQQAMAPEVLEFIGDWISKHTR